MLHENSCLTVSFFQGSDQFRYINFILIIFFCIPSVYTEGMEEEITEGKAT